MQNMQICISFTVFDIIVFVRIFIEHRIMFIKKKVILYTVGKHKSVGFKRLRAGFPHHGGSAQTERKLSPPHPLLSSSVPTTRQRVVEKTPRVKRPNALELLSSYYA